ncbi:MAG: carbon storage regulator [Pirellulaceae bacterium]|nr:carbon storage regulator [Pirellulaceae bacterium]
MLVLTRKQDQMIEVGKNVTIKVLGIKGKSVRIGIDAPDNVKIRRSELVITPAPAEPDFSEWQSTPA